MKVMTIIGTRPEIIRLSVLIRLLDETVDHVLVHTGQNYDKNLSDVFFDELDIRKPDYFLGANGSSLGESLSKLFLAGEAVLTSERPDAVCILGDTNSALVGILAERIGIPVYHMEAGNRSFDSNVPEELNRRVVDHASSFNLPYNEFSRRNLLSEGLDSRRVIATGSPLPEVLKIYESKIARSEIVSKLGLIRGEYLVLSAHRQETVDYPERLSMLMSAVKEVSASLKLPIVFSVHPRTRSKLQGELLEDTRVMFLDPLPFTDYCRLQKEAFCVLSDSGTVSEESYLLDFPAVTIRESMERPEALVTGTILLSGIKFEPMLQAIKLARHVRRAKTATPSGYDVADFSRRVLSIILSTYHLHRQWTGMNPKS